MSHACQNTKQNWGDFFNMYVVEMHTGTFVSKFLVLFDLYSPVSSTNVNHEG